MHIKRYAIIPVSDANSVKDVTLQKGEPVLNIAETHCLVMWRGDMPQELSDLGVVEMSHSETINYLNDFDNGFRTTVIDPYHDAL